LYVWYTNFEILIPQLRGRAWTWLQKLIIIVLLIILDHVSDVGTQLDFILALSLYK